MFSRYYFSFRRRKDKIVHVCSESCPQQLSVRQYEELQRPDRSYQQLLHNDNTVDAEITVHNEYETVDPQRTLLPSTTSITYDIGPPPSHLAPPPPSSSAPQPPSHSTPPPSH